MKILFDYYKFHETTARNGHIFTCNKSLRGSLLLAWLTRDGPHLQYFAASLCCKLSIQYSTKKHGDSCSTWTRYICVNYIISRFDFRNNSSNRSSDTIGNDRHPPNSNNSIYCGYKCAQSMPYYKKVFSQFQMISQFLYFLITLDFFHPKIWNFLSF